MLNEEKIRLMTKLAIYEEKNGKESLKASKYFKNDYISLNMINTALLVSISYLLLIVLWIIFKVDYFMEKITSLNLMTMGKQIIVIYFIVIVLFMLLSYVVYSIKYQKIKENNSEYAKNLKELYLMYKKEEKNKGEAKIGGNISDDETFDF